MRKSRQGCNLNWITFAWLSIIVTEWVPSAFWFRDEEQFFFFFMTLKIMYVIRQETNLDLDDETKLRLIHKTDFRAQWHNEKRTRAVVLRRTKRSCVVSWLKYSACHFLNLKFTVWCMLNFLFFENRGDILEKLYFFFVLTNNELV